MKYTNYENIDKVINLFYQRLPNGTNFYDEVYGYNFDDKEQAEILKFLIDESILEGWGEHGKHILSKTGELIVVDYGGIEDFLAYRQEEIKEKSRLTRIANEKLDFDAKLSKWQIKVFLVRLHSWIIRGNFHSILYNKFSCWRIRRTKNRTYNRTKIKRERTKAKNFNLPDKY
eukprot:TRINITY_DN2042_c0_g1_i3.p1 TRINITY_DN2042_c0_g1~~TRINITY_DN2042_c0_g1_i3.p1  ORF type:complete len:173 (-),score=21.39 TRINITY_DN2042_c0_g1_i3:229-747(-)